MLTVINIFTLWNTGIRSARMLHHCELTLLVNGKTDKKTSATYFHMWDARLSNIFPFKPQIARRWQLCVSCTFLTALKFSPLILSKLSNPWNEMSFWGPRSAQPRWQTDTITRVLKKIQHFTCSSWVCAAHQRHLTSKKCMQQTLRISSSSKTWSRWQWSPLTGRFRWNYGILKT